MTEFEGFADELEDDEFAEEVPDIEQPEFDDVFVANSNENNLGRKREGNDRLSKPILNKLAKSRLISARVAQLNIGAPSLIPNDRLHSNELQEIAIQEFDAAVRNEIKFPIKIVRKFTDGT